MSEIWQTVLAIIGSIGGAAVIIGAVIKFASDKIAERLSAKYQLKLNKELEGYKSKLDNGNYISRAMFEKEFSIYQDLIEKFYEAYPHMEIVNGISNSGKRIIKKSEITPDNPQIEELMKDFIEKRAITEIQIAGHKSEIANNILIFKKAIGTSGAFIPHDIKMLFSEIFNQYMLYSIGVDGQKAEWKEVLLAIEKMQIELREYLKSLTIVD